MTTGARNTLEQFFPLPSPCSSFGRARWRSRRGPRRRRPGGDGARRFPRSSLPQPAAGPARRASRTSGSRGALWSRRRAGCSSSFPGPCRSRRGGGSSSSVSDRGFSRRRRRISRRLEPGAGPVLPKVASAAERAAVRGRSERGGGDDLGCWLACAGAEKQKHQKVSSPVVVGAPAAGQRRERLGASSVSVADASLVEAPLADVLPYGDRPTCLLSFFISTRAPARPPPPHHDHPHMGVISPCSGGHSRPVDFFMPSPPAGPSPWQRTPCQRTDTV